MRQMKIILLIMTVMFFSNSCRKCIFADEELTLSKEPYTGNQLKIDGYYYQKKDNDVFAVYFFYNDGTMLYGGGGFSLNKNYEAQFTSQEWISLVKKSKIRWGVFNIDSNKISFERWYPSSGGGLPVYIRSGNIQNDTTFTITKSIHSKTGEEEKEYEVYHFKAFSPKPDSTNNFIP